MPLDTSIPDFTNPAVLTSVIAALIQALGPSGMTTLTIATLTQSMSAQVTFALQPPTITISVIPP